MPGNGVLLQLGAGDRRAVLPEEDVVPDDVDLAPVGAVALPGSGRKERVYPLRLGPPVEPEHAAVRQRQVDVVLGAPLERTVEHPLVVELDTGDLVRLADGDECGEGGVVVVADRLLLLPDLTAHLGGPDVEDVADPGDAEPARAPKDRQDAAALVRG
jgi:hypothetical protein